jgi:hypothetical protein
MGPTVLLPFGLATTALTALQAACVDGPQPPTPRWLGRLRGPAWAVIVPASIVVVVVAIGAASGVADGLTWLALIAVPPLAAIALQRAWPVAVALLAVAWAANHTLTGDIAAALLTALSCVTLGWLLATLTPAAPLKAGLIVMAAIDAYLVFSSQLDQPNATLIAAAPPADLPRLQFAQIAHASLGYGDLFVAGVLGGVLAAERRPRRGATILVLVLALVFNLLFWFFDTLPGTVPVAVAVVLLELGSIRSARRADPHPVLGVPADR